MTIIARGFVALTFCVLMAVGLSASAQQTASRHFTDAVVRLDARFPGSDQDFGSGIIVGVERGVTYVLTALHVLVGSDRRMGSGWENQVDGIEIGVEFYGEPRRFPGKMLKFWSKELDLAVVVLRDPAAADLGRTIRYAVGSPTTLGMPYRALTVGHGGGKDWRESETEVTSVVKDTVGWRSGLIGSGFSGAPLIDKTRGLLIGMLTAVTREGGDAVSADALVRELDSWRIPHHLRRARMSVAMVKVPGGPFVIADPTQKKSGEREVHVDSFFIDKYEVTVRDFQRFVEETNYRYEPGVRTCNFGHADRADFAMNCVTWEDASSFAKWAGKDLPTEVQWEKAARGITGQEFPGELTQVAPGDAAILIEWPAPVGTFPRDKSPFGAMDMLGNVSEWVKDWYPRSYPSSLQPSNPSGPESGQDRVLRGGSFSTPPTRLGLATRRFDLPESGRKRFDYGFRCVLNEQ